MIKKNAWIGIYSFVFVFILTILIFYFFQKSPYYSILNSWIQSNLYLYLISLLVIKIVGIIWPPISGGIFTLASIPFLGWKIAFITDLCGSILGGTVAYFLARKYGFTLLNKILGSDVVEKIRLIKIKKGKEIEAVFVSRLLFGSVILEAVYYGGGVLNINFTKFLIGIVLSHIVMGIPLFFLAGSIFSGASVIGTVLFTIVALVFVLKTKGRYFE